MNFPKTLIIATLLAAILYGLALAFFQDKGILLISGAMLVLTALYISYHYPHLGLGLAIMVIGLCPFFISVRLFPGLPKLYAEDFLFFYFLGYLCIIYGFLREKTFHFGSIFLAIMLFVLLMTIAVPFFTQSIAKTAPRNFMETVIFGMFFYLLFVNETEEKNIDILICFIAITTLCLSAIFCLEVLFQANPVMKFAEKVVDDFLYLSPKHYLYSGNFYRPYAVYFHPSEAGTFAAMGAPFVFYTFRHQHPLLKYLALSLVGVGIAINFTRGVWVAVALTLVLCNLRWIRRYWLPLTAVSILGAGSLALYLDDTGFGQRLLDPSNLENRFYYWKIGLNMFANYFPFGIGHMNFRTRYLEFADTVAPPMGLDVQEIFVADSVLLTTLVEHGLLGFGIQIFFYLTAVWMVGTWVRRFRSHGDLQNSLRQHVFLQALLIYILAGLFADVQLFTKVTKLFFIILGMAVAVSHFAPTIRPLKTSASCPSPTGGELASSSNYS